MKPIIKYLIGFWALLLIAVGVFLWNAYTKLKPEVFIALVSEQVEKNYPGTRLEVGSVDYRITVDFNMGLKNLVLKRDEKVIGKLEEIELRLPWWLLLFKKGNAQINLSNLVIFIDDDKSNDQLLSTSDTDKSSSAPKSSQVQIILPGYLDDAQFTLRAKNITVMDLGNSRRYFTLNKLLVREFQFGKNSAFELNLPITVSHNAVSYKSELWLFGDLTPEKAEWELKFRGEFRTSDVGDKFQLEDLIIDGKARFKPHELDVTSTLAFFIEKEAIGTGLFKASDKEFNVDLKLTKFPLSFLGLFEEEIKNPYFPGLSERAEGTIVVNKKYRNQTVSLEGHLDFPGNFKLGSSPEIPGKWRLDFSDSKWETSFISPKGEVSFFRRSVIDFKQGIISQYIEELGFSEVDLTGAIELVTPLEKIMVSDARNYSSTSVSFKKCKLGDKIVNGSFNYGISPEKRFYTAELQDSISSFNMKFLEMGIQKNLDVVFSKFTWIPQYQFLAPFFTATSGVLDGKLEGRWTEDTARGQWLSKLKGTTLQAPTGEWSLLMEKTWKVFNIDSTPVADQAWDFNIKNQLLSFDNLLLDGGEPARINGQIDLNLKKKSFLSLTYPKNRKWKPVRKEILEPFWKKE